MADMTHEELIEGMAKAMVEADSGPEGSILFHVHWGEFGEGYKKNARAASAFIAQALKEPTEAMVEKGDDTSRYFGPGANGIWDTMLTASPLYPDKDTSHG